MIRNHIPVSSLILGLVSAAQLTSQALAVDLTVASIEVNQADQFGTTKLFGSNVTWVRVKIGVSGSASPVAGVDGTLRMLVDGQPYPNSNAPTYSLNGPITAPLAPASGNLNDTLNFAVIAPVSSNVDFVVEVNPGHTVAETNFANNSGSANDKNFECRKVMEVAYVPINYTPGGMGLPLANLIEPGIGDGFLRGIYHPGEWNYHKSPLPPLVWNQSINSSNVLLLNTLQDIRTNQLPEAGYPQPHFVYGWLPGNPFSGNGQAGGVPGDVAFGNTDTTRHQRTLAHELGHCFGLQHNNSSINTIGVDTERHLKDTQNLAQLFPTTKKDVMVAGQLTNAAWVAQNTYTVVHNDSRMQCVSGMAGGPELIPVLRVSGVIDHINRTLQLDPVTRVAKAQPTSNHPNPNMRVAAYNQAGELLGQVSVLTGTSRELCVEHPVGKPVLDPTSPLYVLIPETIQNQAIHRIDVVDLTTAKTLAQRTRTPNAPEATITQVAAIDQQGLPFGGDVVPAEPLSGRVRVTWNMQDADGDTVTSTLLYSPTPGRWLPILVNSPEQSFEFDAMDVPSTIGPAGKLKLIVTDGLNVTESGVEMMSLNAPQPPETFLISPNTNDTFPQHAPIAFHAAVWDMQDLMLTGDQVIWTSDIDGMFGEGLLLINSDLSPGAHVITVTATDTEGLETSKQINLTITPRTIVDPDCNGNGVLDPIDIAGGASADSNGDGIPDECATICAADISADRIVDEADLALVIDAWGQCETCTSACAADLVSTCFVDVDDLLAVINNWGPCDE